MWYKNIAGRFFGLATKHEYDRRTDRQTGRITTSKTALASSSDYLEGKRENYQVCSVQYCVQKLCTAVHCTHTPNSCLDWVLSHWTHFTVLRLIFMVALYVIGQTIIFSLCVYCMHV